MCASWTKADNDWLITRYEELTAAREDFMSLVTKSPLVYEEVDQALNSLAARLVCLSLLHRFALTFLIIFFQQQVLERLGYDTGSVFSPLARDVVDYCHRFRAHHETYQFPASYQPLATMTRHWQGFARDEDWNAHINEVRSL